MAEPSASAVRQPLSRLSTFSGASTDYWFRSRWVAKIQHKRVDDRAAQRSRLVSIVIGIVAIALIAASFYLADFGAR